MTDPKEHLKKLANTKMPFGKYKGTYLIDIPESYYVWFRQKGFPKGKLGLQMQEIYEIKVNGLDLLIKNLKVKKRKKNE